MRTACPWEKLAYIPRRRGIRGLPRFDKQAKKASDQQPLLMYNQTSVPAAVQILKVAMMLGFFKCIVEEILNFLDLLQGVVNLETLYI